MMPRDLSHLRQALLGAAFMLTTTLNVSGCSDGEAADRAAALASPSALRLNGAWQVRFTLNRRETMTRFADDTTPVSGAIVIAEDNHGIVVASELDNPTHDGAYDIDFSRFGFSTRSAGSFPEVVARVADPLSRNEDPRSGAVSIILSPGSPLFTVRMTGRFAGDTITGAWSASGYRSAGAAGVFTMRRAH